MPPLLDLPLLSLLLSLYFPPSVLTTFAVQSDTTEFRKSLTIQKMPSKDQSSPPVSILRSSATPVLEEAPAKKSPIVPPLKIGMPPSPAITPEAPAAPIKSVVPRLGLASVNSVSPRSSSTDSAPLSAKSSLKQGAQGSPPITASPPVVPSLKLGSLGSLARDSNPPLSPSSSQASGTPAKFSVPSLKLSNASISSAAISPKGKPEPAVNGIPKKAAIPTLKLPPSRTKPEKEEHHEVSPSPISFNSDWLTTS